MDKELITQQFSQIPVENDENGLIPAFGVYLTKLFGDYYSAISFEFEEMFKKEISDPNVQEAARQLLIEAGHVCGFNTFGGIMKSEPFDAIVVPMIKDQTDWVVGMVSVINVLGWGVYEVEEISSDKLVLKIKGSYEADYYNRSHDQNADVPKCYLALGASTSLMSLVFHGDISKKPELDAEFYSKLFKQEKKFFGQEVSCEAKGDEHCRIIINREN
ncbi:MAG: hypothetical protein GPJ54_19410 [Candidatus Heimdallarchaeota archaeon]|nr:hypothetical protein [Candidatus Heimdallarchaeota archaeon]